MSNRTFNLTTDVLLRAYAAGIFPMAPNANTDEIRWFDPPIRATIPLDSQFHVPRRLKRTIRNHPYSIRFNTAFDDVMRLCAAPTPERHDTWINNELIKLYTQLHQQGHAHSIEAWRGDELVGGLYGVNLGGAFFGESMFSRATDASKISLVYLVALLCRCGFSLLDTQFQTEHLSQFGTTEHTRANYHHLLAMAVSQKATMQLPTPEWDHLVSEFLQPVIQRS